MKHYDAMLDLLRKAHNEISDLDSVDNDLAREIYDLIVNNIDREARDLKLTR